MRCLTVLPVLCTEMPVSCIELLSIYCDNKPINLTDHLSNKLSNWLIGVWFHWLIVWVIDFFMDKGGKCNERREGGLGWLTERLIDWVTDWLTGILSEAITLTRTSNACYSSGGDCGFHFLSCDHGLTISLRTMDYGFKEPSAYARKECDILLTNCVDYVNRTACCEYEVKTDCLKTYSWEHRAQIKERCEGKRGCTFHATYVSGGCENRPFIYDDVSAFSVIRYVCQNVTDSPASGSSTKQIITCDSCTTSPRETTRETSESESQRMSFLFFIFIF